VYVRVLLVALVALATWSAQSQTCPSSCPTREEVILQKQLDATAAAGGGTVQLKPGIYYTCGPLILKSNVHLRGAGRGATIIRGSAKLNGKTVNNAFVAASIGTVGSNNVSISDLTIDHATCGRNANGIAFVPEGTTAANLESYDGVVPTNGLVERVEVLGAPGYHNYMIWNLRGQHMKILDNWVDGGSDSDGPQEGIESYGGYDVQIINNTVKNIGYAGINIGSAGLTDSETVGVIAINNYVTGCAVGVNVGTATGNGGQGNAHTHVRGNVITDMRQAGIDAHVAVDTRQRDLQLRDNTIRNVSGDGAAGIRLRASGGRIPGTAVVASTVEGNHIDRILGQNSFGILLLNYPDARIMNNTIINTQNEGIYAYESDDIEIVGNRIERAGTIAIGIYQGSTIGIQRFVVAGNKLINWSPLTSAIQVLGGRYGFIENNTFSRTDLNQPDPIIVDEQTCGVRVTENQLWYGLRWPGVSTAPCR